MRIDPDPEYATRGWNVSFRQKAPRINPFSLPRVPS